MDIFTLWRYYQTPWIKYAVFAGRASRAEYWTFWLGNFLIGLLLVSVSSYLYLLFAIASLIPSLAVLCRRLHDLDLPGWLELIVLVPIFGALTLLILSLLPGTPGENRYGPDPRSFSPPG
jgi:uncharacterized membrane protein YhaH (DUF805 family)